MSLEKVPLKLKSITNKARNLLTLQHPQEISRASLRNIETGKIHQDKTRHSGRIRPGKTGIEDFACRNNTTYGRRIGANRIRKPVFLFTYASRDREEDHEGLQGTKRLHRGQTRGDKTLGFDLTSGPAHLAHSGSAFPPNSVRASPCFQRPCVTRSPGTSLQAGPADAG